MQGLIEGRIVHYVAYNQRHLAAIVIGVEDHDSGKVNLAVFSDMKNVNGDVNFGLQFQGGILYHEQVLVQDTAVPGTWHWPEKV